MTRTIQKVTFANGVALMHEWDKHDGFRISESTSRDNSRVIDVFGPREEDCKKSFKRRVQYRKKEYGGLMDCSDGLVRKSIESRNHPDDIFKKLLPKMGDTIMVLGFSDIKNVKIFPVLKDDGSVGYQICWRTRTNDPIKRLANLYMEVYSWGKAIQIAEELNSRKDMQRFARSKR